MDSLQISYPQYFLFFIAVIALLYALSLYINDKRIKENKSWLPFVLGWIRFISIAGILFLLLTPLFKVFKSETEKPHLIIALDKSESVKVSTDEAVLNDMANKIDKLKNEWSDRFEISEIHFGEDFVFDSKDSLNTASTNISKPLEYISDAYEDQNLGAVILATDGIYNEGKNPIYSDLEIEAPLYTIALGDTTIRTDIIVKNVLHNRIVYLNDKFLIEADVQAYNALGNKSSVNLFVVENGKQKKLKSFPVNIDKKNYFKSFQFELEANQIGNVKYIVTVNGINNEISTSNNRRNVYIEVLDARQKILLLSSAPHPDIKSIKELLRINKNYEVDIKYIDDNIGNIRNYDVAILHNLPSKKNNAKSKIELINKNKIPVIYVLGEETSISDFNDSQNVLSVQATGQNSNSVTPVLNSDFTIFNISDQLTNKIESFVPLKAPFGDYTLGDGTKVLLKQKIGSVETDYPLWAFSDINNHKQTVIAGEGVWKWGLIEYLNGGEKPLTKELLTKSVQYTSQKEDKRQFRIFTNKNNYKENENVLVDAQLYNDNFELTNTPEAQLTISNEDGDNFEYTLSKLNDYYFIDAGRFSEGNYTYSGTTNYNGKRLSANGKFAVQSIIKEKYDLTAKHDILFQLSDKMGGKVFFPNDIASLANTINSNEKIKPILFQKAQTKPLLDLKWLLGIFILLLALEWFIRRYFGGY